MSRIAVVLFNLGGPDQPSAVRPFLRNLFSDPAIIGLPAVARLPLAALIAGLRAKSARANYQVMGGSSPLNPGTAAQAQALEATLRKRRPADEVRTFVAMRYWRPFTSTTAAEVARWGPDEVVLAPLYPQYSTTTTASSLKAWGRSYKGPGQVHTLCCYFDLRGLAAAHAALIRRVWDEAGQPSPVRLLFSAHGLPERISSAGDPYRWQVERTCDAVAAQLGAEWDWRVCYQSQVGPLKWIGPSVLEELEQAAGDGVGVIVDPIAFVSEHIETLVELDRDYANAAERMGVAPYLRVPALGADPGFIDALADLAERALARPGLAPGASACDAAFKAACPFLAGAS